MKKIIFFMLLAALSSSLSAMYEDPWKQYSNPSYEQLLNNISISLPDKDHTYIATDTFILTIDNKKFKKDAKYGLNDYIVNVSSKLYKEESYQKSIYTIIAANKLFKVKNQKIKENFILIKTEEKYYLNQIEAIYTKSPYIKAVRFPLKVIVITDEGHEMMINEEDRF